MTDGAEAWLARRETYLLHLLIFSHTAPQKIDINVFTFHQEKEAFSKLSMASMRSWKQIYSQSTRSCLFLHTKRSLAQQCVNFHPLRRCS